MTKAKTITVRRNEHVNKQGVSPPMICSFNEIKEKEAKKHNIDNIGCQEILFYAR